jgi:hypothetical protein
MTLRLGAEGRNGKQVQDFVGSSEPQLCNEAYRWLANDARLVFRARIPSRRFS